MKTLAKILIVSLATLVIAAPGTSAQTLYGMDPGLLVVELTGPPDPGNCLYPNGPMVSTFPAPVPGFPCNYPVGLGHLRAGDVAVDRVKDTVWAADDFHIAEYTPQGAPLNGFNSPGPMTPVMGLGFDAQAKTLWVSNGSLIAEIMPPVNCMTTPAFIVSGPWPVPFPLSLVTDVSVDPLTGTLWVCDVQGQVLNLTKFGMPLGPVINPALSCGLGPLLGIAVDTATPNLLGSPQALYVTDGFMVAYVDAMTGFPAPPTFYTPNPCFVISPPTVGLAYSSHGITFGMTPDPPTITTAGQAIPGGNIALTLSGATAGSDVYLLMNHNGFAFPGFLCPPAILGFPGSPVYVEPNPYNALYQGVVSVSGTFTVATGFAKTVPPGLSFYVQFVVDQTPGIPGGPYQVTEGLELTLGLP